MKLSILQKKLKEGINIIQKPSVRSLTLPALNNVLIKAEKNFLSLTTTDLETAICWRGLAKVDVEGVLTIPISLFTNFLTLLPGHQVLMEAKENFLEIESGEHKAKLKSMPADDFPIIPHVSKENFVEIDTSLFCQSLEQVVEIASSSQTRPEISGIFLSFQKDGLRLAATDSFRLGEKNLQASKGITFSDNFNQEISFIIPQKAAREMINVFSQQSGKIKIYFTQNQILTESQTEDGHEGVELVARLIDGEYPAYQEIIPKKYETEAALPKQEFLNNLKMAALFSGKVNEVKLKINPSKKGIEFFSQNQDLGENNSFLAGQIKGAPLEISFNNRFLASGLTNIKSSEVIFGLNKEDSPAVLKPLGDPSYLYVVMPIKI